MHTDVHVPVDHSDLPIECDFCERRPAFALTGDGRPICLTCDENQQEDAWVRENERDCR